MSIFIAVFADDIALFTESNIFVCNSLAVEVAGVEFSVCSAL